MKNYRFWHHFILFFLSLTWGANICHAQTIPSNIPSSADIGKIPSPLEKHDDFSKVQPDNETTTIIRPPELPSDIGNQLFILRRVIIEGGKAFANSKFVSLYKDDLDHKISVTHLFQILTDIQKLYYDNGYTLSKVLLPKQDVKNGIVTFQVIEGYVAEVEFDPDIRETPLTEAFKNAVLEMKPLNVLKLERLLLILNDRPGLSVTSLLSPLATHDRTYQAGAVRLTLKKTDAKRSSVGFFEFNNHGSNFSGPQQMTGGVILDERLPNYSNMLAYYSQATSPQELRQAGLQYTLPLCGASGLIAAFSSSMTRTEPGESLDVLDVKGLSFNYAIGVNYPLIRQRDQSLYVGSEFNYINAYTDLLEQDLFRDRVRTISWDVGYSFSDGWDGLNISNFKVVRGLNILGPHANPVQDLSRPEGKSAFAKIELSAARLQTITDRLSVLGSLRGQYTSVPLLSSEEFSFGGATSGRAYDPSEITGDKGYAATLELRLANERQTPGFSSEYYAFYDFGAIWNIDPSTKSKLSAASIGAGFRGQLPAGISYDFAIALPITKDIDNPPHYGNAQGPRILISLKKDF